MTMRFVILTRATAVAASTTGPLAVSTPVLQNTRHRRWRRKGR